MIATAQRLDSIQEYYFSHKLRQVRQLIAEGKPIINMGIGSPDLAPALNVIEAITKAMSDDKAHEYQSYQGLPELRQAMAHFYNEQFGVALNWNQEILPLMGSKEGILHISLAFLNKGDEVLIPNPGYPTYESVANLVQARPVFYDLKAENNWEPDWKSLDNQDLSRVKLMWVNYPNMPTGVKGSKDLLERLVAFAEKHRILLVNDNPYSFVLNDKPLSILAVEGAREVALELNSLSKTFNIAGWRVGMVSGKATYLDAILKVKSNMDSGMFYGIQKGAIEALKLGKEWFESQNKIYSQRRDLIFELADRLGCSCDKNSAGLFVWAKLPEDAASAELFIDKILSEQHLFITPGTVFGSNGEGYIRLSLCVDEEKIQEAIARFDHKP